MSKDISKSLQGWEYDPDRVSVRIVRGDDGRDKIQMRLDLGLLQMEFDGRPDGQRIEGCESWLEYYRRRQEAHDAENPDGVPFRLESEDCQRLLREGVQYYHRYISFWHLERYELCARDTTRNLRLFSFVREYARHNRDKLQFDQWRPYVTMMHARAVATPFVEMKDYAAALGAVDAGIAAIRRFLEEYQQTHSEENCTELAQLLRWRDAIVAKAAGRSNKATALTEDAEAELDALREELERAVLEERFEDAAALRDQIRHKTEGARDRADERDFLWKFSALRVQHQEKKPTHITPRPLVAPPCATNGRGFMERNTSECRNNSMTKAIIAANLARHKLALAAKYENRSRAASSKPLKAKLKRLSEKYRRQATQFTSSS